MTGSPPPVCVWCNAVIYAAPETKHDGGWIHDHTNAERCHTDRPARRTNLATPRRHNEPRGTAA